MASTTHRFANIDILRGFAALSVVIYHIIEIYPWPDFLLNTFAGYWFRIGWMGVDLFFVISGFVIALSIFTLMDRTPESYRKKFLLRRFARIAPLFYLTGMIFMVFCIPSIFFEPTFLKHALTHLTFTHNLFRSTHGSINGANWSVATEMQFYLAIMMLAPLLRRVHPLKIITAGFLIAWAWRAGCYLYLREYRQILDTFSTFVATTQLPGMLDEFALGIVFARFVVDDREGKRCRAMAKYWWIWPIVATAACYGSLYLYWRVSDYWATMHVVVFWRSLLAISCLSVVVAAASLSHPLFLRIGAPMRYFGTISYGIYLWHLPIMLAFKTVPLGDPARYSLYVLPTIVVFAALSWHLFEKPFVERAKS